MTTTDTDRRHGTPTSPRRHSSSAARWCEGGAVDAPLARPRRRLRHARDRPRRAGAPAYRAAAAAQRAGRRDHRLPRRDRRAARARRQPSTCRSASTAWRRPHPAAPRRREPVPRRAATSSTEAPALQRRAELPQPRGARRLGPSRSTSRPQELRPRLRAAADPRAAGQLAAGCITSIAQGALVKAINLFKMPSSDPFTTVAILRTMAEIDPDHPVVQSMSAVYWRGGDERIERMLYRPQYFDKIVAWGGGDAINNVIKYLGPGLPDGVVRPQDVDLDDRPGGLRLRRRIGDIAETAATDVAMFNQEACVASRFIFVEGERRRHRAVLRAAAAAARRRPRHASEFAHPSPAGDLREEIEMLQLMDDDYEVWGKTDGRGLVIRSDEPVDFHPINKTANVVRVDSLDDAVSYVNVATQTIGIYPFDRMPAIATGSPAAARSGSCASVARPSTSSATRTTRCTRCSASCTGWPTRTHEPRRSMRRAGHPTKEETAQLDRRPPRGGAAGVPRRGYEGASVAAIAAAGHTTKASLYARYASKEALFAAVVSWAMGRTDWPYEEPPPPDFDDLEAALTAIAVAANRRALDPSMVQAVAYRDRAGRHGSRSSRAARRSHPGSSSSSTCSSTTWARARSWPTTSRSSPTTSSAWSPACRPGGRHSASRGAPPRTAPPRGRGGAVPPEPPALTSPAITS